MSEQQDQSLSFYTEQEIAEYSRLEIQIIRQLAEDEVISAVGSAGEERCYTAAALAPLRRARRLYQDLGINLEGVEIILRLIAHIETLQQELAKHQRTAEQFREGITGE